MSEWVMTTYRQDEAGVWHATEYVKDGATTAKHGAFTWPVEGENAFKPGHGLEVKIYDNTENGLCDFECTEIAQAAVQKPIYWSDDRVCHWMFDFKCAGYWCAGLFFGNGLEEVEGVDQFAPLHINVTN